MNKENKKKKLNEENVKNVSGGYIGHDNKHYTVYSDTTNEVVVDGIINYRDAEKLNNLYNYQDQVEENAKNYDGKHKPWEFWAYKKK